MTREQIAGIERAAHERGRRAGYVQGGRIATDRGIAAINTLRARLVELCNDASQQLRTADAQKIAWPEDNNASPPIAAVATIRRSLASTKEVETRNGVPLSAEGGGEMRLLRVLVAHGSLTRGQWATLSGVKPTGSTFRTYVSRLRTAGYVVVNDHVAAATIAGSAAAGHVDKPKMTEVISAWRAALGSGCFSILDYLLSSHPRARSRHEIAAQCEMQENGSTLRTYLSRLKTNGLIEIEHGEIKAADVLFLDEKMAA